MLWDSGSDETLIRKDVAACGKKEHRHQTPLEDVQGNPIPDYGSAKVGIEMKDEEERLHQLVLDGRVADTHDNVISAGKVIRRRAFRAIMDYEGGPHAGYLERKDCPDIKFPLFLIRNSFYLKAFVRNGKIRLVPEAAPATPMASGSNQEEPFVLDDPPPPVAVDRFRR